MSLSSSPSLLLPLQESFLEDINNILNSGEVPNLWLTEDQETISAAMRPLMAAAGIAPTKQVRSSCCLVMSRPAPPCCCYQ